jgi:crossover junction endodeoxyribonuclease RusA
MSGEVRFTVRGIPQPQGSSRARMSKDKTGKLHAFVATDAHDEKTPLGSWRTAIADGAREAMDEAPLLAGPLKVWLTFVFPRPSSHYLPACGKRPVPVLRADAPIYKMGKPDLDKLLRSALDAMTGIVWRDDSQVVAFGHPAKIYEREAESEALIAHRPGVEVYVRTIE